MYAQVGSLMRRSACVTIPPCLSVSMSTKTPSPSPASVRTRPSHRLMSARSALSSTRSIVKKLPGRGPLKFVYEAGPCGFWLQRYLHSVGQQCLVAVPSLIPRRPGVRIKTDRLDARAGSRVARVPSGASVARVPWHPVSRVIQFSPVAVIENSPHPSSWLRFFGANQSGFQPSPLGDRSCHGCSR